MSEKKVSRVCERCNKPFLATPHQPGRFCSRSCVHRKDLAGQVFGYLTVLERAGTKQTYVTWRVRCVCGVEKVVLGNALRKGGTKSCGCKRGEMASSARGDHHQKNTPTWRSWEAMRQRCQQPKDPSYARYGGRGIRVHEPWNDFLQFLADMGPRPPGTTLDRVDNNGNYEPGNCRWATAREQSNNKRNNRLLTFRGETKPMMDWVRMLGGTKHSIRERLRRGWTVEQALSTPLAKRARRAS